MPSIYLYYGPKLDLDWFNNFSKKIYFFICIDSSLCFDFISIHHGQWPMAHGLNEKVNWGPSEIDLHARKKLTFFVAVVCPATQQVMGQRWVTCHQN